ncbi:MAG: hypothetical protein R6W06_12910 [Prochlorococcaceae cyanobacterium]
MPGVAIARMKRISIAISDQLHRDLKTLAVYQDETLTSLVTRLLKGYLELEQQGEEQLDGKASQHLPNRPAESKQAH